jgi:hypothetical protein
LPFDTPICWDVSAYPNKAISKSLYGYGHEEVGHRPLSLHILEVHGDGIGFRFAHDHPHASSSADFSALRAGSGSSDIRGAWCAANNALGVVGTMRGDEVRICG